MSLRDIYEIQRLHSLSSELPACSSAFTPVCCHLPCSPCSSHTSLLMGPQTHQAHSHLRAFARPCLPPDLDISSFSPKTSQLEDDPSPSIPQPALCMSL